MPWGWESNTKCEYMVESVKLDGKLELRDGKSPGSTPSG